MKIGPHGIPGSSTKLWKYMKLEHLKRSIENNYFWFSCLKMFEKDEEALTTSGTNQARAAEDRNWSNEMSSLLSSDDEEKKAFGRAMKSNYESFLGSRKKEKEKANECAALCLIESTNQSGLMWKGYGSGAGSLGYVAVSFRINTLFEVLKDVKGLSVSRIKYLDHWDVYEPEQYGFQKNTYFINEMEVRVLLNPEENKDLKIVEEPDRCGYEVPFKWTEFSRKNDLAIQLHAPNIEIPKGDEMTRSKYLVMHKKLYGKDGTMSQLLPSIASAHCKNDSEYEIE